MATHTTGTITRLDHTTAGVAVYMDADPKPAWFTLQSTHATFNSCLSALIVGAAKGLRVRIDATAAWNNGDQDVPIGIVRVFY